MRSIDVIDIDKSVQQPRRVVAWRQTADRPITLRITHGHNKTTPMDVRVGPYKTNMYLGEDTSKTVGGSRGMFVCLG